MATALREWLPWILPLDENDVWLSKQDIDKGSHWPQKLSEALKNADVGIVCCTPENKDKPWLLFESGALSRDNFYVCTFLYGFNEPLTGPLSHFQHTISTEQDEVLALADTLNHRANGPKAKIAHLFESLWPKLESRLKKIPDSIPLDELPLQDELDYLRQKAVRIDITCKPKSADLFFNGKLLGSSPQTIYVNPDAPSNTISASAVKHFDDYRELPRDHLNNLLSSYRNGEIPTERFELSKAEDMDEHARRIPAWLGCRRKDPNNPVVARAIASYLVSLDKAEDATKEAIDEAEALRRYAPRWALSHSTLGFVQHESNPKEAIRHYSEAILINPGHYIGYFNRACAHSILENFEECINDLELLRSREDAVFTFHDLRDSFDDSDFDNIKKSKSHLHHFEEITSAIMAMRGRIL